MNKEAEQMMNIIETQHLMERARKLVLFAKNDGEAIAGIVDKCGVTIYGGSPQKPVKVSAKAAASMPDDELKTALREARAVVSDQQHVQLSTQAKSMHELARVSAAVAAHIDKLAKEHEACFDVASLNAEIIEKELTSRADERARQEAARAELDANLPEVVAELQRQIDELRAKAAE